MKVGQRQSHPTACGAARSDVARMPGPGQQTEEDSEMNTTIRNLALVCAVTVAVICAPNPAASDEITPPLWSQPARVAWRL